MPVLAAWLVRHAHFRSRAGSDYLLAWEIAVAGRL